MSEKRIELLEARIAALEARADHDTWREKADANQAAADTLERLRRGESITIADEFVWLTTRDEQWAIAERDALYGERTQLAVKVGTLEHQRDALAAQIADLERRLAESDRDAERWRDVSAKWRAGCVLQAMEELATETREMPVSSCGNCGVSGGGQRREGE